MAGAWTGRSETVERQLDTLEVATAAVRGRVARTPPSSLDVGRADAGVPGGACAAGVGALSTSSIEAAFMSTLAPHERVKRALCVGAGAASSLGPITAACWILPTDHTPEREPKRVVMCERTDPGHELGPVEEREPFLRTDLHRNQAGVIERGSRRSRPGPVDGRLALAHDQEGDVRQGRQVARSAEAAPRRHHRVNRLVEHADEELDRLDANAGQPHRERIGTQDEHGSHHLVGQCIPDAGSVRADEIPLQSDRVGSIDAHVRQVAEPGRHAVDGGALVDQPIDHRA
jgi:hypothetical protein